MSEAWREVARLGKKGEKYPHILVDSHGWCLRIGSRDREDEKYFSSLLTLLKGLSEHLIRRKDHDTARAVAEMKALLIQNLKEAKDLGEELERRFRNLRLRPENETVSLSTLREPGPPLTEPQIAAGASESGSEAA